MPSHRLGMSYSRRLANIFTSAFVCWLITAILTLENVISGGLKRQVEGPFEAGNSKVNLLLANAYRLDVGATIAIKEAALSARGQVRSVSRTANSQHWRP